jgi:ribosomal protein S11
MSWITFETTTGGLVVVQRRHIVSIYDEQGEVKLATTAGGVHSLKDVTVQQAAAMLSSDEEAATALP